MQRITIIVLIVLLFGCQTKLEQKFNLGFEIQKNTSVLSNGWFKWGNYILSIDSTSNTGQKSGKITSTENGQFGCIAYKIPANYSGMSIELKGYMKIKNVENGFAGIMLRVDNAENKPLAFDNMQNQNISGTTDWQKYKITIDYPEDAANIYVAGILTGKGEAWYDDFELYIDGQNVQTLKEVDKPVFKATLDKEFDSGSKIKIPELNSYLIDKLELLGRIWGFLKYYHPEIANGNYNWDYELFRFLPSYLKITNDTDKEKLLLKWIDSLGKIKTCGNCKQTDAGAFLKPDLKWINNISNNSLKDKLQFIYENRSQGKQFYIEMATGVGNPVFKNERDYVEMQYPDDGFRLLALYRYWNMINYFFPYKYLTDKDWNIILKEYIPTFLNAQNELEYELAALQIIGDIHDSHANLLEGKNKIEEMRGMNYAPFQVRFFDKKLVVTNYYNIKSVNYLNHKSTSQIGLNIGDIITKIDNKSIDTIVADLSKFYPASNEPTRLRDISKNLLRSQKSEIEIEYLHDNIHKTETLQLYTKNNLTINQSHSNDYNECFRFLDNNIGYVTLKSIKDDDITKIKESFKNAKGIIIDIRNYPSTFVPFKMGTFFVTKSTPFVKFTKCNIDNPGEFKFTENLEIPNSTESYKGKLVVIVNEQTQSQAEYTAMAFRAGVNTTIIGSTTAGADGNVSTIFLPGGLSTMISGIGVFYPNGEETQRIGIIPDIEVKPTIEGIKKDKDELIEKAIEIINKNGL